jgi:hypothetical protein
MKITRTFIYFSLLLTVLYIVQWWLLFYYFENVPEYIPDTDIRVTGLLLALTILPVVHFFLKALIRKDTHLSILQLVGLGVLLAIVTEVLFQLVRQSFATISLNEKISESLDAIVIAAIGIGIISFIIAFKLKHPKSIWNTIFWILFFVGIYFLRQYTSILH